MEEVGEVAAELVSAGAAAPPDTPGVYAFHDAAGRLLYVGSSRSLARRVRSYFSARHAPASKQARIARLAAIVRWQRCPSILEALVVEARTIRCEGPHFNRRLKTAGNHAWVRADLRDPFPRLEVTRRLDDGPWRYLGPFPGGRRLRVAVEMVADALRLRTCDGRLDPDPNGRACLRLDLGQCAAPCLGQTSPGAYGRELARALAALGGGHPEVATALGACAASPTVALPPHIAGTVRALRAARIAASVLVILPAAGAPGLRLVGVAGGRVRSAASAPDVASLAAAFARVVDSLAEPPPAVVPREDLDEVRLVTAWLASPAGRPTAIDLARVGRAGAWARVLARATPGPLFSSRGRPARG